MGVISERSKLHLEHGLCGMLAARSGTVIDSTTAQRRQGPSLLFKGKDQQLNATFKTMGCRRLPRQIKQRKERKPPLSKKKKKEIALQTGRDGPSSRVPSYRVSYHCNSPTEDKNLC